MTWPPYCGQCGTQHINSCEDADDDRQLWAHVTKLLPPIIVPREIAIDWGLIPADTPPEPTPVERALAILAPHLNGLALYRQEQP